MKRLTYILACILCVLAIMPTTALAKSLDVVGVDIAATVEADGSLVVVERRSYQSKGSYNGILWDVPQGSYQGREVLAAVAWVAAIEDGQQTYLEEGSTGVRGTYELADEGDHLQLKMYWPMEDETATIEVAYVLANVVSRWEDAGELYWQYVPADEGSQGEWLNVTCTVGLPVPDGAEVRAGENVRAWGHGPLDGEVSIEGGSIRFFSPGVGSAEFLEARVVFPPEWLTDVQPSGQARLDAILAEEDHWAKDANSSRRNARLVAYGLPAFMCLAGIGSAVASFLYRRRIASKGPKPTFTDTYFRDVPSNDHPAVLGMLYREGRVDQADFSATLMRLTDKGRIALDAVEVDKAGKRGGTNRGHEWRLTRRTEAAARDGDTRAGGKKIDNAAMSLLFDVVAGKPKQEDHEAELRSTGEPFVLMSDFEKTAEQWPSLYQKGYDGWDEAVHDAYNKRTFVADVEEDVVNGILGLGDFALAVVFGIVGMLLGVPSILLAIGFIVWFAAGLYIVWVDEGVAAVTYTQEAVDLRAKLEALKRWLVEFTRLEEAIPTDVVLWNRLLVMATVLGVADKVVEQLRVYMPELMGSSHFWAADWYRDDVDDLSMPCAALDVSMGLARDTVASELHHDVSTSSSASSRNSSSRGSGGGFSSGGGGGFSGGGGRGGGF